MFSLPCFGNCLLVFTSQLTSSCVCGFLKPGCGSERHYREGITASQLDRHATSDQNDAEHVSNALKVALGRDLTSTRRGNFRTSAFRFSSKGPLIYRGRLRSCRISSSLWLIWPGNDYRMNLKCFHRLRTSGGHVTGFRTKPLHQFKTNKQTNTHTVTSMAP